MKRLMMTATMAGALIGTAANQTYTWPDVGPELRVGDDGYLTAILPGINISIR